MEFGVVSPELETENTSTGKVAKLRRQRRWKFAVAQIIPIALLAACSRSPEPNVDFCEEQRRRVPAEEKILSALAAWSHDQSSFDYEKAMDMSFPQSTGENNDHQGSRRFHALASAYLEKNPHCCSVSRPWIIDAYHNKYPWENTDGCSEYWNQVNRQIRWTDDIKITEIDNNSRHPSLKFILFHYYACRNVVKAYRG